MCKRKAKFLFYMGTVLQILGSLGLFLFGMKLMSEGLQKVSGERLRSVMRSMAGNRFKGVFSGTLVTAGDTVVVGDHRDGSELRECRTSDPPREHRRHNGGKSRDYHHRMDYRRPRVQTRTFVARPAARRRRSRGIVLQTPGVEEHRRALCRPRPAAHGPRLSEILHAGHGPRLARARMAAPLFQHGLSVGAAVPFVRLYCSP